MHTHILPCLSGIPKPRGIGFIQCASETFNTKHTMWAKLYRLFTTESILFSLPKIMQLDTLEQNISVSSTERLHLKLALRNQFLFDWEQRLWWDRKTSMRSMFDSFALVGFHIGETSDELSINYNVHCVQFLACITLVAIHTEHNLKM